MTTAIMKDGGEKQTFETGAVRDTAEGKPQYHLLPPFAWLLVHTVYGESVKFALETCNNNLVRYRRFLALYDQLLGEVGHTRLLEWLRQGAEKYSEFNWAQGMPCSRCIDSLGRHLSANEAKEDDEDHLAAALCNVMFICHFLQQVPEGATSPLLDFYDFNQ